MCRPLTAASTGNQLAAVKAPEHWNIADFDIDYR